MFVQEIDLFKGLDYAVVKKIAEICDEEWYLNGKVLFKKSEKANHLFILRDGIVNLSIDNNMDFIYPLSKTGEIMGWSCLVDSGEYTATAVCASDVTVYNITKDKLNRIFNKHPEFGQMVLRRIGSVFTKRLTHAYQEIISAHKNKEVRDT